MLAYTVFTVSSHLSEERESAPDDSGSSGGKTVLAPPSQGRSLLKESKALMLTGVSSKVPIAEDYKILKTIPWKLSAVQASYRAAGVESACVLLETGTDVIQPLVDSATGTSGALGRRCAFSIRLQLGKELGEGLPSVTRGIIEDYLKAHQLTIQPSFYHDEQSQLILSPVIRASFVRLDTPALAASAEPMIAKSIAELRTLGAYWNDTTEFSPALCRTLILGFQYTLDVEGVAAKPNTQREYELVFLHLLKDATVAHPKLAVFATSDARTQFHLLEATNPESVEQSASITADVRFADSKMLGMYPEAPVVTKVRHRALLTIPADLVQAQIDGLGGGKETGFSDVLDSLYERAMGELQSTATSSETTELFEAKPALEPTPETTEKP
ncbi:MAG: hypothetical protein U0936_26820 [Planctomycetaceae bacterium]